MANAVATHDRFTHQRHFTDPKSGLVDETTRSQFETVYNEHRGEIDLEVETAVEELLAQIQAGQKPSIDEEREILASLEAIASWDVAPKSQLLRASVLMPRHIEKGDFAAALREYGNAEKSHAGAAGFLRDRFTSLIAAMLDQLVESGQINRQTEVRSLLESLRPGDISPDAALLSEVMGIEQLRTDGRPFEALKAYFSTIRANPEGHAKLQSTFERCLAAVCNLDYPQLSQALEFLSEEAANSSVHLEQMRDGAIAIAAAIAANPPADLGTVLELFLRVGSRSTDWSSRLTPHVSTILGLFEKAPQRTIAAAQNQLVSVGEHWKLPKPFVLLAKIHGDTQEGFDMRCKAAELGDFSSKAIAGHRIVNFGKMAGNDEIVRQGLQWVKDAAEAENPDGLFEMGLIYQKGEAIEADYARARELLARAMECGHLEARFHLGIAQFLDAEESDSTELYRAATTNLEAVAGSDPQAYHFLYGCYSKLGQAEKAREALELGVKRGDPRSLYRLGLSLVEGSPPFVKNVTTGREHIISAAQKGHEEARQWIEDNRAILQALEK